MNSGGKGTISATHQIWDNIKLLSSKALTLYTRLIHHYCLLPWTLHARDAHIINGETLWWIWELSKKVLPSGHTGNPLTEPKYSRRRLFQKVYTRIWKGSLYDSRLLLHSQDNHHHLFVPDPLKTFIVQTYKMGVDTPFSYKIFKFEFLNATDMVSTTRKK